MGVISETFLTMTLMMGLPSWSPDGKRIAFASYREAEWPNYEIYVMDTNGGNQQRLTKNRQIDEVPLMVT